MHISSDVTIDGTHDMTVVEVNDKLHNYRAKVDGKITFNDSEDDVATLSGGGSAVFSETRLGKTQRIEIANRGGKLEHRYFVDDKEQAFDATAHQWMATLIPTVIRETAIDAEGRVARIRAKGGADAVIDEIGKIDSGYARGVYLRYLAAGGKLTAPQMTRALKLVDGIDSDYEKRNALVALASVQPLDAEQQKLVLAQADKIGSAYERAELLVGILPQLAPADDVRAAWLEAASGIDSDYEHRRALSAMLESGRVDEATLAAVVAAARTIDSDYERRTLLTAAVQRTHDADKLAAGVRRRRARHRVGLRAPRGAGRADPCAGLRQGQRERGARCAGRHRLGLRLPRSSGRARAGHAERSGAHRALPRRRAASFRLRARRSRARS